MPKPLRASQIDLLRFVIFWRAVYGYGPTSRELARMMGRTVSTIWRRTKLLADWGYMHRGPGIGRWQVRGIAKIAVAKAMRKENK